MNLFSLSLFKWLHSEVLKTKNKKAHIEKLMVARWLKLNRTEAGLFSQNVNYTVGEEVFWAAVYNAFVTKDYWYYHLLFEIKTNLSCLC